jgi:hypothetical protein
VDVRDTATVGLRQFAVSPQRVHGIVPEGECVDFENDLPDDAVDEITSLLAKGFLRYWKSQCMRPVIAPGGPAGGLDSRPTPSLHVSVVYAERTGEK